MVKDLKEVPGQWEIGPVSEISAIGLEVWQGAIQLHESAEIDSQFGFSMPRGFYIGEHMD